MIKQICYYIWTIIGIAIICLGSYTAGLFIEHGASAQGVTNAIVKHVQYSCYADGVWICDSFAKGKTKPKGISISIDALIEKDLLDKKIRKQTQHCVEKSPGNFKCIVLVQ